MTEYVPRNTAGAGVSEFEHKRGTGYWGRRRAGQ